MSDSWSNPHGAATIIGIGVEKLGNTVVDWIVAANLQKNLLKGSFPREDDQECPNHAKIYESLVECICTGNAILRRQALRIVIGQIRIGHIEHLISALAKRTVKPVRDFLKQVLLCMPWWLVKRSDDVKYEKIHLTLQLRVLESPHRMYSFLARVMSNYPDDAETRKQIAEDLKVLASHYGKDLLRNAFAKGQEEIVDLLIKKVEIQESWTAQERQQELHEASSSGRVMLVQRLLERESSRPTDASAGDGSTDAPAGKSVGKYGVELRAAAANGHREIVKLLLDHGADIHAQDPDSRTGINAGDDLYNDALRMASDNNHEAVVALLRERRANNSNVPGQA